MDNVYQQKLQERADAMKNEILKILSENISIIQSSYMNGNADLEGISGAADELQQLMCYREVKQHLLTLSELGLLHYAIGHIPENEISDIINRLKDDYPESMILEAIEKVKNESK